VAAVSETQARAVDDVDGYRRMLLIRGFEDLVQKLFLRGEVYGTTHLYSGQEAVAVGVAGALRDGDRVACTYRGHGHTLAMGASPKALLAEMLGRATGINGGRAGSMNVVDPDHGLIGSFGIVGGSIAAATGAALALKGSGSIAVAYFGDGATNQAYFFECLNFAKVLNLPVLFVCENNGYGEYTPMEVVTGGGSITARAEALGVQATQVDGMDVTAVRATAMEVTDRIRATQEPELIEALTYRFVGHSRSDPGAYRPAGELERWRERDPLVVGAAQLRDRLGDEGLKAVADEVETELALVETSALAAPFPEPRSYPEFKEAGGS
jgi:TPP-dependent pyruvate/acetoin dehydrogenase alpha subunit